MILKGNLVAWPTVKKEDNMLLLVFSGAIILLGTLTLPKFFLFLLLVKIRSAFSLFYKNERIEDNNAF